MKKLSLSNSRIEYLTILLLVVFRICIQIILYKNGFLSITADEFGRVIQAAEWSQDPYASWSGMWLPFYMYLFGAALKVYWNLLWVPRGIVIVCGLLSIFIMYLLTKQLFNDSRVALVSATLFSLNPAFIWLSSTPLTEMPYSLLILAFLWLFVTYLGNQKRVYLFFSAFALVLVNGFRFEAWLITGIFSAFLMGSQMMQLLSKKSLRTNEIILGVTAIIPWIFPCTWIIGNYLETGDPFFMLSAIKTYKLTFYGQDISYLNYWNTFLKLDPYLTISGVIALFFCVWQNKKSSFVLFYGVVVLLPLIGFIFLHGGQVEPQGNYLRYLAPFTFTFYPAFGFLINRISTFFSKTKLLSTILLSLMLGVITWTQIQTTLDFVNDPASDGVAVGLKIKELREKNPELARQPVLIELSYWQYLAIQIGANDVKDILYDREPDMATRKSQSLLLSDLDAFKACISEYDISYIVVKQPELQNIVESKLHLQPSKIVNNYSFYSVAPDMWKDTIETHAICPLLAHNW